MLVENLNPNILCVSQTCHQGHVCIFDSEKCEIKNKKSGKVIGIAMRNTNNVYTLENENQCYVSMVEESWLWHRRLGHLSFDNLAKIRTKEPVRDLIKIIVPLNSVCRHFNMGSKPEPILK